MTGSSYAPWWRRFLQKHAKFLFKKCPRPYPEDYSEKGEEWEHGNYHWRWDDGCRCQMDGRIRGWDR